VTRIDRQPLYQQESGCDTRLSACPRRPERLGVFRLFRPR